MGIRLDVKSDPRPMHKRARMQERGDLMVLQERVRLSALERAMEQARQRRAQADLNALKHALAKSRPSGTEHVLYTVVYARRMHDGAPHGRAYAHGHDGAGLQSLSRVARATVCDGEFTDVDIVNCNFALLQQLAEQRGARCDALRAFNADRERILDQLMQRTGEPRSTVKQWFTALPMQRKIGLFGDARAHADALGLTERVDAMCAELSALRTALLADEANRAYAALAASSDDPADSPEGAALTFLLQDIEHGVLMRLCDAARARGLVPAALMFDGLLLSGAHAELPLDDLASALGSGIRLAIKPMRAAPLVAASAGGSVLAALVTAFTAFVQRRRIFRAQSAGGVFDRFFAADEQQPWACRPIESALCVAQMFQRECDAASGETLLRHHGWLVTWIERHCDARFPERDVDGMRVGYSDGVLHLETLRFERAPACCDAFACVTWPRAFPGFTAPTPRWDALVSWQLPDADEREIFHALLGRLFYRVEQLDSWQVILGIQGAAGTGKSTALSVVQSMFPEGSVATVCDASSTDFVLENKHGKRCILIPDASERLPQKLTIGLLKTMACGEITSVNAKGRAEVCMRWTTPVVLAFNRTLAYPDDGGAWTRRLACVPWTRAVPDKDTGLLSHLQQHEAHLLFPKLLRAYARVRARVGDANFWTYAPPSMLARQAQTRAESNELLRFIDESDRVVRCARDFCTLVDFKRVLRDHRKSTGLAPYRWSDDCDRATLAAAGYEILDGVYHCTKCSRLKGGGRPSAGLTRCACVSATSDRRRCSVVLGLRVL
jgi:hypothetical protein